MKVYHIISFLLLLTFNSGLNAQSEHSNYRFKLGLGTSLSGAGDIVFYEIQNGLQYKPIHFISFDFNLITGSNRSNFYTPWAYIFKTDGNILISPFGGNMMLEFKTGAGISYYFSPRKTIRSFSRIDGEIFDIEYNHETISAIGLNLLAEIAIRITSHSQLSIQAHVTPYWDGIEINSGISMNFYRSF